VRAGIEKIPGLEILTPSEPAMHGSILTFHSPKLGHKAIFERLLVDFRLRCRPVDEVGLDATRISTHLFNSVEECDHLIAAITEIFRKT
jgi:selenocysteine lyase/cysteine desulfurase